MKTYDYSGLTIPATAEEADGPVVCTVLACKLSGRACALRRQRAVAEMRTASAGTMDAATWQACAECPAGEARAVLLGLVEPTQHKKSTYGRTGTGHPKAQARARGAGGHHKHGRCEAALAQLVEMLARPMTIDQVAAVQGVTSGGAARRLRTLIERGLALRVMDDRHSYHYGSTAVHRTEAGLAASVQEAP